MNIVKLMVIIIYLIIGSALGIIIIPEIANDLGLQNSSFLKNHYVDGIIGSIFMFLIFGVFIRRVTNAIKGLEHFIVKRKPYAMRMVQKRFYHCHKKCISTC
ncbi:Pili retraction protein pilT [Staphylococcus aureus]|nr:Pili retraction protein pilT [Staphylococcus aureus]